MTASHPAPVILENALHLESGLTADAPLADIACAWNIAKMRSSNLLAILATLCACAPDKKDRQERLMDEIETSLRLPRGAMNLDRYARYYTEDRGLILGAFTTEIETRPPDVSCSELTNGFEMIDASCPAVADLAPGHRRWVPYGDYPAVADENCRAVQIAYNPKSKSFEYNECVNPIH